MSKKLAGNPKALVLDVKWGSGAFMKRRDDAKALAESLVRTGRRLGLKTTALLTDMNQPNGRMAGNAVEVQESIDVLKGGGPSDLSALTLALGTELLLLTERAKDTDEARQILQGHLDSGRAYEKFCQMVAAQGGNPMAKLLVAPTSEVTATQPGHITACDTEQLGLAIIEIGGGRKMLSDKLDHATGLEILVRLGDRVEPSQPLARMFAHPDKAQRVRELIRDAWTIGPERMEPPMLIVEKL
jgi:thymidine phosphorylase